VDPDIEAHIHRIQGKLNRLRELDPGLTAFGASSHEYRFYPPLPESEVVHVENRLGVKLPSDYRRFLTRVGGGGAGPYYGIFPPDVEDPEDITSVDQTRKPFRWNEGFNPMEWENPCAQEDVLCDEEDEGPPFPVLLVPGALYICNYGCAIRFFLVVNGNSYGEVWIDRQADEQGLEPVCGSFLEWYENWLNRELSNRSASARKDNGGDA
jgi:hypothetical protein